MGEETHKKFLSNLSKSNPAVWTIARWLQDIGYTVIVSPLRKAPARKNWKDYADDGDLHVLQRIEVKKISKVFSSRSDWPFGDDFIVCARHSFDRARIKPFAYIIVSADSAAYAVVKSSTSKSWRVESRNDARYGPNYSQEFYLCPIDLVKFGRLNRPETQQEGSHD